MKNVLVTVEFTIEVPDDYNLEEICVGKPSVFISEGVEVQPVDWNTTSVFDLGNGDSEEAEYPEHFEYYQSHWNKRLWSGR